MNTTPDSNSNGKIAPAAATERPAGGELLARAAQGAHAAVDATVAKVAPVIDGVHDKVEAVRDAAGAARDAAVNGKQAISDRVDEVGEWVGAARDAVRAHPFAAIAAALLVGAAYNSLTSRRR